MLHKTFLATYSLIDWGEFVKMFRIPMFFVTFKYAYT